jgi:rhamnulokinase
LPAGWSLYDKRRYKMSKSKFLAFDFGAESGRAIIGILENEKIQIEEIHRFPNKQIKILGHIHWDVLALFEEMKKGMSIAVQKGHSDINSIGIDTWGVDFGLIGKENNILGFPYCYRDSRTNGVMEELFNVVPRQEVYGATGIQFMQFNSLFQLFSYAKTESSLLDIADKLLFMPDLFNFLLTGQKKSEYSIASTSQMLNAKNRTWDKELITKLGLPLHILPEIILPGTIIGKLLPEIANEVGLNEIDVIAPGCHDTASAVAAVPAQEKNWAYLSSGTWSIVGVESDHPIISEESLKFNFTNEGGVENKIRFLSNVMGMWLLQQTRKSWQKPGDDLSYDELAKLALNAEAFKCLIDPDDNSFLNPPDMPAAIIEYCKKKNLTAPESKGEFVRCILESLALKYKLLVDRINAMQKNKIEVLHIVGGGSQNEILNQFTADACGIPVIAGPVECTALGNILVQAIAKKKISSIQEGRKIIENSFSLKTYLPTNTDFWKRISFV